MKHTMKRILGVSGLGITILSSPVYASGYKLEFQSPSVLADAGDAAVVEDAGTNWYNSAGLVYLPQQLTISSIDLYERTAFRGTATAPSAIPGVPPFNGTGKATSYANSILPAIHYALPIKDQWSLGLSVVPAWGLLEDYGEHSVVRYNLTRIYTRTIDIAPSLAWKINDQLSLGAGPDFHYFSLEEKAHVYTEGPPPFGTPNDSASRLSANNWGYGYHAGVLFRLNDKTRIGLNYRSKISMDLKGYSSFNYGIGGGPVFTTNKFQLTLPMPPTTSLSVYHDVTPIWAIMGTVAYDHWSVIRDLHGLNFIQPPTPTNPSGLISPSAKTAYSNTFDISAGTHYKVNEKLLLRGSLKYEQTPTNNKYRDVNFPDGEKLGINIGARYQMTKKLAVDVLYAHVFTWTVPIHGTNPASFATTNGKSDTTVDLAGAQLVWNI